MISKKVPISILIILVLGATAYLLLQHSETKLGNSIDKVSQEPHFEDYLANEIYKETHAVLDFSSDPTGSYIREDRRKEATQNIAKIGPNFAGHYYIISDGCGTSCSTFWAADLTTGKLYALLGTSGPAPSFRLNSRLMIYGPETSRGSTATNYYVFDNNQLKLVYNFTK